MIGAQLGVAVIALVALAFVPYRRSVAAIPVALLCVGAAMWSVGAALDDPDLAPDVLRAGRALSLSGASVSAAAAFASAQSLVDGRWRAPWWFKVAFVVEPLLVTGARLTVLDGDTSEEFRGTAIFLAHSFYCFALLLGVILVLNSRQRDVEPRVRTFVITSQIIVIAVIALEVASSVVTPFAVVAGAVFAVRVARHPEDWNATASRADRLIDSIGVFLFVFDHTGLLREWNGTGARLIELITGRKAARGLPARKIIGLDVPFEDGSRVDLDLHGGSMRTSAHIHVVAPTERSDQRSWVVMLRPVRSSVGQESFPAISGALEGYDPASQTIGRRAVVGQLRAAAVTGGAAVRVDVLPSDPAAREDEVMFVVARRLESMFPETGWGRFDVWTFVAVFDLDDAWRAKRTIDIETQTAVGLAASVSTTVCAAAEDEDPERFVRRVELLGRRPMRANEP